MRKPAEKKSRIILTMTEFFQRIVNASLLDITRIISFFFFSFHLRLYKKREPMKKTWCHLFSLSFFFSFQVTCLAYYYTWRTINLFFFYSNKNVNYLAVISKSKSTTNITSIIHLLSSFLTTKKPTEEKNVGVRRA